LRIYNQKCESKLESRQTLINHLEDKLSSEIGNYKEKIVALEAEIKVLTGKNRQNEEKTQQQLQAQKRKLLADFKLEHDEKIKNLEAEVVDNEKQKGDLRKRLERILREHDELSNEFRRFRGEKETQEAERNRLYEALEKKIVH
jgi:chromosome segregation ATPase